MPGVAAVGGPWLGPRFDHGDGPDALPDGREDLFDRLLVMLEDPNEGRRRRLEERIAKHVARTTPAPRRMWPSLALAWVKGFVTAMAEIKLSDWQKALRKGGVTIKHEGPAPEMVVPDKTKQLPVIFVDGEAWTPTSAAKTGSGPYRENPTSLRRVTPAEAALIATQAAERARRYMTFTLGLVAVAVLLQVLRLISGV